MTYFIVLFVIVDIYFYSMIFFHSWFYKIRVFFFISGNLYRVCYKVTAVEKRVLNHLNRVLNDKLLYNTSDITINNNNNEH